MSFREIRTVDGVANSQEKFLETNTIWNHEMNVVERQFAVSLLYFYMMFWVYQQRKVITTQPEPFLRVVLAACNLDGWGNVFSETKSELAYCLVKIAMYSPSSLFISCDTIPSHAQHPFTPLKSP